MCQLTVGRIEFGPPAVQAGRLQLRLMEHRIAEATIRRRKAKVLARPTAELSAELRRLYRREVERVVSLLQGAVLPYTPRLGREKFRVQEALMPHSAEELTALLLNGVDIAPYEAALVEAYRDILPLGIEDILNQVRRGIGIGAELMDNPRVQEWIKNYTIRFGKTWAPKVSQSLNHRILGQLAQGWKNHEGTEQLIKRVRDVYREATDSRAEMIARTESNRAYNAATMEAGRELGANKKFWISSGSLYAMADVCGENADLGSVGLEYQFRDTEGMPIDGPPAHPNCLCDVGYEFDEDWQLPEELFAR